MPYTRWDETIVVPKKDIDFLNCSGISTVYTEEFFYIRFKYNGERYIAYNKPIHRKLRRDIKKITFTKGNFQEFSTFSTDVWMRDFGGNPKKNFARPEVEFLSSLGLLL